MGNPGYKLGLPNDRVRLTIVQMKELCDGNESLIGRS